MQSTHTVAKNKDHVIRNMQLIRRQIITAIIHDPRTTANFELSAVKDPVRTTNGRST